MEGLAYAARRFLNSKIFFVIPSKARDLGSLHSLDDRRYTRAPQ